METRITTARALGKGTLELTFEGEGTFAVDLQSLIARGNLYAKLADPAFLGDMQLMYEGLFIQWPDDFDVSARTLWEMAQEQRSGARKRKIS